MSNDEIKGKSLIYDGEEYVAEEPISGGMYFWKIRNINDDTEKTATTSIVIELIGSYEEDYKRMMQDDDIELAFNRVRTLLKRVNVERVQLEGCGVESFYEGQLLGISGALEIIRSIGGFNYANPINKKECSLYGDDKDERCSFLPIDDCNVCELYKNRTSAIKKKINNKYIKEKTDLECKVYSSIQNTLTTCDTEDTLEITSRIFDAIQCYIHPKQEDLIKKIIDLNYNICDISYNNHNNKQVYKLMNNLTKDMLKFLDSKRNEIEEIKDLLGGN